MKDASKSTTEAAKASETEDAIWVLMWALLLSVASIAAVLIWHGFGIDFYKVLAVSLTLATLALFPVLDMGRFLFPLIMMVFGLIVAVLVWLMFSTGFFTVFAVSLILGILFQSLMGKEGREELRGDRDQARRNRDQAWQKRLEAREREKRRQQEAIRKIRKIYGNQSIEPRAMPYEEYLQTPHWKRKREDKVRAAGHRCQVCNRGSVPLNVHHRTYERLGEELDEDLTVLCRECHRLFHETRRLGR